MSWFWRPRNTWEKSRPLIPSGWSSLPPNFSASATPRNSASRRNSRKSSLYTTSTRIPTHGESHELSRNFTQKLPFEDIIMLFFFSKLFTYLYMLVCVHFRGIFTLVHTMVNEFCSRSSDSSDCCFLAFIVMHLILDQSYYLLLLVHVQYMMGIWFEISWSTHAIPIHLLYEIKMWKCFYICTREHLKKKIVKSAGYMPNIPAVLKFCHFFSPCLSILDHYLKFC